MTASINKSVIEQFFKARIESQQEYFLHPPYMLEQQMLEAVEHGDRRKAFTALEKINAMKRATLAHYPLRSLRNSLICSCTLFTRAIIRSGINPEDAFHLSDAYILQIEKTDDMDALKQLEYDMLSGFIDMVSEEQHQSYSQPVSLTISYIHDNILQDFSLEEIAQHVFINPSYLSHLFKKEVGVPISEYINKKRLEESKFFLIHTNTSISDIALLFKFCNQSYYTSLFKKYMGLTPREFRRIKADKKSANE